MMTSKGNQSRRQFLGTAAASVAGIALGTQSAFGAPSILQNVGKPNSLIRGVQIGAITYSFRSMPDQSAEDIIKYTVDAGISAVEYYGSSAENFAGIPQNPNAGGGGGGRGRGEQVELTAEQRREQEEIAAANAAFQKQVSEWRLKQPMTKFEQLAKMFKSAGVSIYGWKPGGLLGPNNTEADYAYAFRVAKALGASHLTVELPEDPSHSLRLGKAAEKSNIFVAYHTHLQGSLTACDVVFSQSPNNRSNVDIGHYVAAGGDPLPFLKKFNERISSIHIKDRKNKENGGVNMPYGQGDTPLVEALQLMRDEKYKFAASIEMQHTVPEGSDAVKETAKCVDYCRKVLNG